MWRWLKSTKEMQSQIYGYPLEAYEMAARGDIVLGVKQLTEYLNWNQTAAVQEMAEVREEFSWKPWATDAPFVNRDRIIDEIVDVNHFNGNILTALGCTDEEYEYRYQRKQQINRERALSGNYSAKKGGLAEGSDARS